VSKQSEAWERYDRHGRYRDAERCHSMIWTAGYCAASIPLCALLERIEWGNLDYDPQCQLCGQRREQGHAVGCEVDAYLSEERQRRKAWGEVPA